MVKVVCERAGVPWQIYVNHSDIAGGSTIGNILTSHVSPCTADIGLAQLSMHSPYETAGAEDGWYLERAAEEFFGSSLYVDDDENLSLIRPASRSVVTFRTCRGVNSDVLSK